MNSQLHEPKSTIQLLDKPKKMFTWVEIIVVLCIVGFLNFLLDNNCWPGNTRQVFIDGSYARAIGFALYEYEHDYHCLPPAYTVDGNGNQLHSWRTLLLPYLEQAELYNKIDLTKPWDAPQNARLLSTAAPYPFGLASVDHPLGHTCFRAVVHPRGVFSGSQGRSYDLIPDDKHQTILFVQADSDQSTPWMKPEDYTFSDFLKIDNTNPAYPDGSTHIVTTDTSLRKINVRQTGSRVIESMVVIDNGIPAPIGH